MKKIIYGLLILIGGVLIISNFNVDSSKIDHKTVSASGTACKWISESGYGVGPYYIDKGKIYLFSCTSTNSATTLDGNKIYTPDKNLYKGSISLYYFDHSLFSGINKIDKSIKDGVLENGSSGNSIAFNQIYETFWYPSETSDAYYREIQVNYDHDINNDNEFTFTCVCAEY